MNYSNLVILVYHGLSEPFTTAKARKLDYFNEACLALITYFLFLYNDFIQDEDLKYLLGWVQVSVLGINIAVNCSGALVSMVKETLLMFKIYYFKI